MNRACDHCHLPVGRRALERTLEGETRSFCCYGCCIAFQVRIGRPEESQAAWLLIRLGVGAFLSMNVMLISLLLYVDDFSGPDAAMLPWLHLLLWVFATPALIILGEPYLRDSWAQARQGRVTASALVVIGVGAAYIYSLFAAFEPGAQVYFDTATMVLMLFTVGDYLEAAGRAKAARDLEPLLAAESEMARVVEGEAETLTPVRDIVAGMRVRVRPAERVPVDGAVIEGLSHSDEAVITGESRPVAKEVGSAVIAGSINLDGPLLIEASGAGSATRWARICRSVRDALSRRGPTQRLADRIVGYSVPLVLLLGIVTVIAWAQVLPFDKALLIGLAVLVVACPCAVGLAAPMATSLGLARLARSGCLVRDPAALETLARLKFVAFDKTGTLTAGRARLAAIACEGATEEEALARAAGLERHSEHGLARAIRDAAAARGLDPIAATDIRAIPGRGIRGMSEAGPVAAGNGAMMAELGWPLPPTLRERARALEASGHSVIHVGWGGEVRAVLALDDIALPEARATIAALRALGLHAALLTGDLAPAARRVAVAAGIDVVQAELSPEAKRLALDAYASRFGSVAMVGDGLNDGPVLAMADVGIAVGSATDLARETAGVVLPPGGLKMLPWIVTVARAVRRTILTNLLWAFGYNLVALALAVFGLLQPVLAAAVMASSSLLLVVNSLRLSRLPDPAPASAPQRQPGTELDVLRSGADIPDIVGLEPERG